MSRQPAGRKTKRSSAQRLLLRVFLRLGRAEVGRQGFALNMSIISSLGTGFSGLEVQLLFEQVEMLWVWAWARPSGSPFTKPKAECHDLRFVALRWLQCGNAPSLLCPAMFSISCRHCRHLEPREIERNVFKHLYWHSSLGLRQKTSSKGHSISLLHTKSIRS